jgi:hypothetical protein
VKELLVPYLALVHGSRAVGTRQLVILDLAIKNAEHISEQLTENVRKLGTQRESKTP